MKRHSNSMESIRERFFRSVPPLFGEGKERRNGAEKRFTDGFQAIFRKQVEPQPISKINIKKICLGKTPSTLCMHNTIHVLITTDSSTPNSLFNDNFAAAPNPSPSPSQTIRDTYDITCPDFQIILEYKLRLQDRGDGKDDRGRTQNRGRKKTRGQSANSEWKKQRQQRLTASNFGSAITCLVESSNKVKSMLYNTFTTQATQFGNSHEEVAVDKYLTTKRSTEPKISCREFGLLDPGWGEASLDRIVVESTGEEGLEVKCPLSNGETVDQIVKDKTFCQAKLALSNKSRTLQEELEDRSRRPKTLTDVPRTSCRDGARPRHGEEKHCYKSCCEYEQGHRYIEDVRYVLGLSQVHYLTSYIHNPTHPSTPEYQISAVQC
ncbi:hypothetical protein Bbelb_111150 [Branchiostoma belcheri]|nr:hypothetical protein Bbelb_111150 [Branchiostoma belcheri]